MQSLLSLLRFAAALQVDPSELRALRWQIGALAVFGTLLSTALVGFALWWTLPWAGLAMPPIHCLLTFPPASHGPPPW